MGVRRCRDCDAVLPIRAALRTIYCPRCSLQRRIDSQRRSQRTIYTAAVVSGLPRCLACHKPIMRPRPGQDCHDARTCRERLARRNDTQNRSTSSVELELTPEQRRIAKALLYKPPVRVRETRPRFFGGYLYGR